ncbi:MAG TPA: hypothetical protein VGE34_04555 [Candidatus Saccharimonadales bacterium]
MIELDSVDFRDRPPHEALEAIIARDREELEALAHPGQPLTAEWLGEMNPALVPIARQAEAAGIGWPDGASAVMVPNTSPILSYQGEDADKAFATAIISDRSQAFNNFPQLISARPEIPAPDEAFTDYMLRNPHFAYASKPYLYRAYMLKPEFMTALRESVGESGMTHWNDRILQALFNPEFNREDVVLLTGSRIAYTLLANLMRQDDTQRQYGWLGMSETDTLIEDAATELWS